MNKPRTVNRTRSVTLLLSVVGLALMVALYNLAPVGAQSGATVRVSNLEQAEETQVAVGGGQTYAQSFHTGSVAVTLEKVRLHMRSGSGESFNPGSIITIRADSSGEPGAILHTLTSPTIDATIATHEDFTSSSGYRLAADTDYWLVMERPRQGVGPFIFSVTDSGDESTAETGWSLRDSYSFDLGTSWLELPTSSLGFDILTVRMAIYGSAAPPGGL